MAEKKWIIILGIINIFAMAGIIFWYMGRDNTPPVITREQENVYVETMSDVELLQGITAVDKNDGDVSDTLVVEKITVNYKNGTAMVTCGAMDESGNIAKQSFQMKMQNVKLPENSSLENTGGDVFTLEAGEAVIGIESIEEEETEETVETEEETTEEETTEEETTAEESEETDEGQEEEREAQEAVHDRQAAQNTQPQINPEEIPVLNFGAGEVKTKKGLNPAWVTVISQLQDNKDSYEYLLQHLLIHGNFTNAEAGSYDVSVSTVDSDGHESEARAIRIIVEE